MTLRETPRGLRKTEMVEVTCPECFGAGSDWFGDPEVTMHSVPCLTCAGRGFVYRERVIPDPREVETC